ncbi:protein AAR2 homolog [Trifolium pratense]|uniref:protein AAR2 homolog n=1 Tax=Trifolium pratense TaxID=57577 RepID=UPI001E6932E4|nr:protein AAR2 homolog [Trifolium pratense]
MVGDIDRLQWLADLGGAYSVKSAYEVISNGGIHHRLQWLADLGGAYSVKSAYEMFSVGPAFKGIKMIPPGTHFVYYSSSTRDGKEFSPIVGFFIDVGPSKVIVRKWDQQEERLVKVSEEEEGRYSQAVKNMEFDQRLGPYNHSNCEDWKRLSNFVLKGIIERLEPIGGEISVDCKNDMFRNTPKTSMEEALDKQLKVGNSATSIGTNQRKGCYYTSVPHGVKRNHCLLMGQSLEAFLQWGNPCLAFCLAAPKHLSTRELGYSPRTSFHWC